MLSENVRAACENLCPEGQEPESDQNTSFPLTPRLQGH